MILKRPSKMARTGVRAAQVALVSVAMDPAIATEDLLLRTPVVEVVVRAMAELAVTAAQVLSSCAIPLLPLPL
jgi:hypothetical protein